jgi:hypothetical protein
MKKAIGAEGAFLMFLDNTNSGNRDPNPGKSYMIYTGTVSLNAVPLMDLPVFDSLGVQAELAGSRHVADLSSPADPVMGSALQGNLFATITKMLKLKAGYRQVAYEFVSPGAQTRLVTPGVAGSGFQNDVFFLYMGLEPSFFQNYFRGRIQFTRDNNNWLNYSESMNTATPNRQGIFADVNFNYKEWAAVSASGAKMQECRPIGSVNPRDFLRVQAEASVNLAKVMDIPGLPKFSGFYVMENNDRADDTSASSPDDETENFKIRILGAEAVIDLKTVKFIATYQKYVLSGRKVVDGYNGSMQDSIKIAGYKVWDFGTTGWSESLAGGGAIFRISQAISMQVDAFWVTHGIYDLLLGRAFINAKF